MKKQKKPYLKPEVVFAKKVEVIAAVCSSTYSGLGGCRTIGTCKRPRS